MTRVFVFACALLLAGCGGEAAGTGAGGGGLSHEEPFRVEIDGFPVHLGADVESVVSALGEPLGVFEAPSCAFDGTDIVFRFRGAQLHTVPRGPANYVHTILLLDDLLATAEGVRVGSSLGDVLAAYGDGFALEFGAHTFRRGHTGISFLVEGGVVTAIIYELDIDGFFGG